VAKLDDQIALAEERLKTLKLRSKQIEARRAAQRAARDKKVETRRRILVGAVVLARVRDGSMKEEELRAWLDPVLTRTEDRALFGLD